MKKTWVFPLLSALLILWLLASDWIAPPPNAGFFVRDEAQVLSRSVRMEIAANSAALAERTGRQLVVVTIGETENTSAEQYATELLQSEVIDKAAEGHGLVLAIDTNRAEAFLAASEPLRYLTDRAGQPLIGLHELENISRDSLLLHRKTLNILLMGQGIHTLPHYGIVEKTLALTRAETAIVLALITVLLIVTGRLKRRFYPPHYPLEKEGPFQPANAPDLLTRKPR